MESDSFFDRVGAEVEERQNFVSARQPGGGATDADKSWHAQHVSALASAALTTLSHSEKGEIESCCQSQYYRSHLLQKHLHC